MRYRVWTGAGQVLVCDTWLLWKVEASFGANGHSTFEEATPRAEAFAARLNELNERELAKC